MTSEFNVIPLSYGYYIFKFVNWEDLAKVRVRRPWVILDQVIALEE